MWLNDAYAENDAPAASTISGLGFQEVLVDIDEDIEEDPDDD